MKPTPEQIKSWDAYVTAQERNAKTAFEKSQRKLQYYKDEESEQVWKK